MSGGVSGNVRVVSICEILPAYAFVPRVLCAPATSAGGDAVGGARS